MILAFCFGPTNSCKISENVNSEKKCITDLLYSPRKVLNNKNTYWTRMSLMLKISILPNVIVEDAGEAEVHDSVWKHTNLLILISGRG